MPLTFTILEALRAKDYTGAQTAFDALMQRKVQVAIHEEKKALLEEHTCAECGKDLTGPQWGKSVCVDCAKKAPEKYTGLKEGMDGGKEFCDNCGQWKHDDLKGGKRCLHDCQAKGFDPKPPKTPVIKEDMCPSCGKSLIGGYNNAGSNAQGDDLRCKNCGSTQGFAKKTPIKEDGMSPLRSLVIGDYVRRRRRAGGPVFGPVYRIINITAAQPPIAILQREGGDTAETTQDYLDGLILAGHGAA